MANATAQTMIVNGIEFNPESDYMYTKPKVNASGGKSIGIINRKSMKGFYMSTPLMLTWGVQSFTDDKTGVTTYDMSLQFPKEDYSTPQTQAFLENMKKFEAKIKADAMTNCKEWMNKAKTTSEVIDALWTPMLKYPKDKETSDFDYTREPTLRIKIPMWEGVWKCELYDMDQNQIFPNEHGLYPPDLIAKATNVATVIQCGGLWFANGKFGVTWRFVQAVVKPKQSLMGKCLINLSSDERSTLEKSAPGDDDDDDNHNTVQVVNDSSDDEPDKSPVTPAKEVKEEIEAVAPAAPKKKVVRKKKTVEEEA